MAVTLESLKNHLGVTLDDDDEMLTEKLAAAKQWVTGYIASDVDADSTPAPVDEAVRQLAAWLYEQREAALTNLTAQSAPLGFLDLLAPYRAWAF